MNVRAYTIHRNRPQQNLIKQRGNAYLQEKFPNLDYITSAIIAEGPLQVPALADNAYAAISGGGRDWAIRYTKNAALGVVGLFSALYMVNVCNKWSAKRAADRARTIETFEERSAFYDEAEREEREERTKRERDKERND